MKGKAFPFNNLSKADYLPAAEPRKKQNRSPAKRVRFWEEERDGNYQGKGLKGKAFPFNNLSKADYLPAAEPRKKQNRSPAKRVRFWKEEPRSTDEKKATAYAIAFFEPCGVNSDVEAPPGFEPGQSRICSPLPYHLAMAPNMEKRAFSKTLFSFCGAAYEARTRYLHLGKVALYQMS